MEMMICGAGIAVVVICLGMAVHALFFEDVPVPYGGIVPPKYDSDRWMEGYKTGHSCGVMEQTVYLSQHYRLQLDAKDAEIKRLDGIVGAPRLHECDEVFYTYRPTPPLGYEDGYKTGFEKGRKLTEADCSRMTREMRCCARCEAMQEKLRRETEGNSGKAV